MRHPPPPTMSVGRAYGQRRAQGRAQRGRAGRVRPQAAPLPAQAASALAWGPARPCVQTAGGLARDAAQRVSLEPGGAVLRSLWVLGFAVVPLLLAADHVCDRVAEGEGGCLPVAAHGVPALDEVAEGGAEKCADHSDEAGEYLGHDSMRA